MRPPGRTKYDKRWPKNGPKKKVAIREQLDPFYAMSFAASNPFYLFLHLLQSPSASGVSNEFKSAFT